MGKTINGLAATEGNRQRNYSIRDETGKEQMMITAAAERLGRTPQWLYGLIRQGKVLTQYVVVGRKRYQVIPDTELERLKRELEPKTLRRKLIESLASARGICESRPAGGWSGRRNKEDQHKS